MGPPGLANDNKKLKGKKIMKPYKWVSKKAIEKPYLMYWFLNNWYCALSSDRENNVILYLRYTVKAVSNDHRRGRTKSGRNGQVVALLKWII